MRENPGLKPVFVRESQVWCRTCFREMSTLPGHTSTHPDWTLEILTGAMVFWFCNRGSVAESVALLFRGSLFFVLSTLVRC